MYLAQKASRHGVYYVLRQSFRDGSVYRSRDVVDLGRHPEKFIIYSDDSHYQLDNVILNALEEKGVDASEDELEELFFPFLDPSIRYKLEPFRNRHKYRKWQPMGAGERLRVIAETHVLDKRRIHFLRFGHCSTKILDKSPPLYKVLFDKSRDEIEQLILDREMDLPPQEYKNYLFSIFDLQRFFMDRYARAIPSTLDQEKVDEYFLKEYCRLDQDLPFWAGYRRNDSTPKYLLRYLFMYFDIAHEGDLSWNSMGQRYRRARRAYRPPASVQKMSVAEAVAVFDVSHEQIAGMTKKQLTRLYRKKAHTMHPDKGGDHDQFVLLTAAYNELLHSRP